MFSKFFKKSGPKPAEIAPSHQETEAEAPAPVNPPTPEPLAPPVETGAEPKKASGFFARIKEGLKRTSSNFAEGLGSLILGRKTIDEDLFEELESQLLVADVGLEATASQHYAASCREVD